MHISWQCFFYLHIFFLSRFLHVRRTDGENEMTELLPLRIRTRASTPQSWLCPLKLAPCRSGRKNSAPCSSSRWETGQLLCRNLHSPPPEHCHWCWCRVHAFPSQTVDFIFIPPLGARRNWGFQSYSPSHRAPARSGDVAIWASLTGKEASERLGGK